MPVSDTIASGIEIQKPRVWWRFVEVCGARRHRSAATSDPRRGHHSQMPVSDRMSIPTPAHPTIWRPEYWGIVRFSWKTCRNPNSEARKSTLSSTAPVGGSR